MQGVPFRKELVAIDNRPFAKQADVASPKGLQVNRPEISIAALCMYEFGLNYRPSVMQWPPGS